MRHWPRVVFALECADRCVPWQDDGDGSVVPVDLSRPGRYRVQLPTIRGFEPVPAFEIDLPDGAPVVRKIELKHKLGSSARSRRRVAHRREASSRFATCNTLRVPSPRPGGRTVSASVSSHRVSWLGSSLVLVSLVAVIPLALAANGCASKPAAAGEPLKAVSERIGVYDSRSVAIAWVGTEAFNQALGALRKESEAAKAAGDRERAAALEKEGVAMQEKLHLQGFSTAPVDDILAHFQERIAELRVRTGVATLVSKWDAAGLAQHAGAEQLDVTEQLVDAMHPTDKQRKTALEIVHLKPMPLADAKKIPPEK